MPETVTLYHPDLPGEPTKTVAADRKRQIELLKERGWRRQRASAADTPDTSSSSTRTRRAAPRRTDTKEKR